MNNDLIHINTLPPFKHMCCTIGNLPSSFMESMTYYEALCWLYEYFEKTLLPEMNNQGAAITELQEAFVTLKNYVDNYFDNLDVQEEINNKLDAMAEAGTLEEIIADYLNTRALLCFNNIQELKAADNLIDGCFVKTLGYYTANDGGEATYKIRDIVNTDVVDEALLIALNDVNLVAELIHTDTIDIKQLGCKAESLFDNKNKLQIAVNNFDKVIISNGDFYISTPVTLKNNINISGINAKIYTDTPYIFSGNTIDNILIENLELESTVNTDNTINMSESTPDASGYTTLSSIVDIYNSTNITINNCKVHGSFTGLYIHSSHNVNISNCNCYDSSSKIICLSQSVFNLNNNYLHDIKVKDGDYYECYLFQATDNTDNDNQELSIIKGNKFENNPYWDAIMSHRYNKMSIISNNIKNVRTGIDLSLATTEVENGNLIISDNYLESTSTDKWNGNSALNHGILLKGDSNQVNVIISHNIIRKFGNFLSPSGGCNVVLDTLSQLDFNNNILEMSETLNTTKGCLNLRGTINNLNINNNVISSASIVPVYIFNLTSNLTIITNNILNTTNSIAMDSTNGVHLTKAKIDNIATSDYQFRVRSGDDINGVSYTANYMYPTIYKRIKTSTTITGFTVPANSKVQKTVSKTAMNYSGSLNTQDMIRVYPIGAFNSDIIITAYYSDSANIKIEFYNMSGSDVVLSDTTFNIIIEY